MEDMDIADQVNHCVICSVSIELIPASTTSSLSPSHLKLANAFIQCLTLDPDCVEDLSKSCPFCLQCKLKLEEWDFCQNQMVRLRTRLRQLKAGLTAKLLEAPWQLPLPDTWSKLNRIRQSVKKRFDPQVVMKKTDSVDPKTLHRTYSQGSSQTVKLIAAVSPGKFIYKGKIPFSHSSGQFKCDLCAFSCEDGGRGRASIVSHMKAKHYSEDDVGAEVTSVRVQAQEDQTETADCDNLVRVKLEELNGSRISEGLIVLESSSVQLDEDPLELDEEEEKQCMSELLEEG